MQQAAAAPSPPFSSSSPLALAERYLSPVLSPIATLGIIFVVSIFALLQKEDLRDRLIRLMGSGDLHKTTAALDDAGRRLSRYFLTQLAVNAAFGAVIGVGLYFIGVPNPVLWALLSALLRFVPYIGSAISAALPIALAAAVSPGWSMAIWTAALYAVAELLAGQAIEPILYGHSTGISPFAVVVAAIFWSWLWGPVGLILSTPLTLCLVVLGRYIERLQFVDVLLGDRPPLTPVESFYQRVLAGDADEAQDHAELLLKERSLSSYYDEVALKGLQLAANDAQRGVLRPEQLERVKDTIGLLVAELAAHEDREPGGDEAESRLPRTKDQLGTPDEAPIEEQAPDRSDLAARMENGPAGFMPRRSRPPRRGCIQHACATSRKARTGIEDRGLYSGLAREHRQPGYAGNGDGLRLVSGHQWESLSPSLSYSPTSPTLSRRFDPGRTVAGGRRRS